MTITALDQFSATTPDRAHEVTRWTANAEAWDRWADPLADLADRLNQPFLDAARIAAGQDVLDLASGSGEPALSAARRVGAGGHVVATDLVPAMLAGAQRRARTHGVAEMTFGVADMAALPFPDAAFDRVTCRFGIMFCPEADRALAETLRVLRPGGIAAFMAWGPQADNTLFQVLAASAIAAFGDGPAEDMRPLFRYAEPGSLTRAMTAAGFTAAEEHALRPVGKVPADRPFWKAHLEMSFNRHLAGRPADTRGALEADITRRFRDLAVDGTVPLNLHARIGIGIKETSTL